MKQSSKKFTEWAVMCEASERLYKSRRYHQNAFHCVSVTDFPCPFFQLIGCATEYATFNGNNCRSALQGERVQGT